MPKKKPPAFEKSLSDLEDLVAKMNSGELSLEDSLNAFEQGIGLIRQCQQTLQTAEQKVQTLIETDDGLSNIPFKEDD